MRRLGLIALAVTVSGCPDNVPPVGITSLSISATPGTISADGKATSKVTVGGEGIDVTLTVDRGTFADSGSTTAVVKGGSGMTMLVSCDANADASCAGVATIQGSDGKLTGMATVKLVAGEICNNGVDDDANGLIDCADPKCDGKGCVIETTMTAGTCQSNMCVCNNSTEICDNGMDDNCDGKIDCADPTCNGKRCVLMSGVGGACNGTSCACPGVPETGNCADQIDNDCDGKVDCNDTDCQPSGNQPGGVCNATTGMKCGPGPMSTCSVCDGNGGNLEIPETSCGDGHDNDCDGLADCLDPDCYTPKASGGVAAYCSVQGKTCSPTKHDCECIDPKTGMSKTTETACGDNLDDDCDGLIDCKDPDCQPGNGHPASNCAAPGATGTSAQYLLCTSAGACACQPPAGAGQPMGMETSCNDGIDNDCNGQTDCADASCRAQMATCTLDATHSNGTKCNNAGTCVCTGNGGTPQPTESLCADGKDNDCNGAVDCADIACQPMGSGMVGLPCDLNGNTCSTGGTCTVCSGNGGVVDSVKETHCADGFDNDCNGLTDCQDPACAGKACNPGDPTAQCQGTPSVCRSVNAQYALQLTTDRARIPADGINKATITAQLTKDNGSGTFLPVVGATITFTGMSTDSKYTPVFTPPSGVTDINGKTSTAVVSDTTATNLTVIGTATISGTAQTPTGQVIVSMPQLGQVKFISAQANVMGVRFSSFQETDVITFQLFDANNQPYPDGLEVAFSHQVAGGLQNGVWLGSFLGATPNCINQNDFNANYFNAGLPDGASPAPHSCGAGDMLSVATSVTDANGNVTVTLHSGTVASVVSVQAVSTAGSGPPNGATPPIWLSATASNLAIVGAKASGSAISIGCTPNNVAGLSYTDCSNSRWGDTHVTCVAHFADRFGNVLGISTLATFNSEAGAAGPPVFTPIYDPANPNNPNLGSASDFVNVLGYSLPADVAPLPPSPQLSPSAFPGESYIVYNNGCGRELHNPRDGLVSIIVSANGEEGFVDGSNGCPANGVYDGPGSAGCAGGENFIDIGEPYIDANDNGMRDANESYRDSNNNGKYDPPNGTWDGNTLIWSETRVLYSAFSDIITGSSRNDTQLFGEAWTPLTQSGLPVTGPSARSQVGMAWDPVRLKAVVFGGNGFQGDTWEWSSATMGWIQLMPASSPVGRAAPFVAWDPNTQKTLLFGGFNGGATPFNDTWTWDGSNWTALSPTNSPSPREEGAISVDVNNHLILFGGNGASTGSAVPLGDTWSWDGSNWTQLSPANSPSARWGARMAYDSTRHVAVLFGGVDMTNTSLQDVWEWNGANWTQVCTSAACTAKRPRARSRGGLVYDSSRKAVVLFGGYGGGNQGDTWTWDGTQWLQLLVAPYGPDARRGVGMVFDSSRRLTMLFGGRGNAEQASRWFDSSVIPPFFDTTLVPTEDPAPFVVSPGMPPSSQSESFLFCDDNLNHAMAPTVYAAKTLQNMVTVAITSPPDQGDRTGMRFNVQWCPRHPFGNNASLSVSTTPGRVRVSGLANLTTGPTGDLGAYLSIDGSTTASNNGTFVIAQVVDANTAEIINPLAANLGGAGTTGLQWSVKPATLSNCVGRPDQCPSAPCYVETSVYSFSYGTYGVATITGGGMCSMPPDSQVEVSSALDDVLVELPYAGFCQ